MQTEVVNLLIVSHVLFGSIALISSPIALSAIKGSKIHILSGRIFSIAMYFVSASAIIVTQFSGHDNFFLFCIGVFSAYLTFTGNRYLKLKKLHDKVGLKKIDKILPFTLVIFAIGLLFSGGIFKLNFVALFFASIALLLFRADFKIMYLHQTNNLTWLHMHIQRMIAATIAAFTAFLVVNNNNFLPNLFAWILPTMIGTPLIFYFIKKQNKSNS